MISSSKKVDSLLTFLAALAVTANLAPLARAAFPGKNGRIALLNSSPNILTINPDGSDARRITDFGKSTPASWQSWAPDGGRIVFSKYSNGGSGPGQLWIMNADGSHQRQVLDDPNYSDNAASFSPDGVQVVFTRCLLDFSSCAIHRVRTDGSGLTALTHFGPEINDWEPVYSTDGRTIAFDGFNRGGFIGAIYLMDADGSHIRRLTEPVLLAENPSWSPDGTKVVFSSNCCGATPQVPNLWVIDADGTGLTRLTANSARGFQSVLVSRRKLPDLLGVLSGIELQRHLRDERRRQQRRAGAGAATLGLRAPLEINQKGRGASALGRCSMKGSLLCASYSCYCC